MDILLFAFNGVAPLVLMVALGYYLARIRLVDDTLISKMNKLLFNIIFPIKLFFAITQIDLLADFNPALYGFVIAAVLLTLGLLFLIVPRLVHDNGQRGSVIQGIYRGNFLFIGYPLAENLFGQSGIGPTAMLLPLVIALYNLIAVFVLEYYGRGAGRFNAAKIFGGIIRNPLIIGALLGAIVSLLPIELPTFLNTAGTGIGQIANPMALILLGGQFSWQNTAANLRLLIASVTARMLLIPVIVVGAAVLLGFRGSELLAIFVLFSAPTAVSSYIMAKNMNCDGPLAGQIVILTTIVSAFSIFAGVFVLRALNLF